ncbi:MAG: alanine racemase [Helicobacteraceae bacterium]|jgi:alanine racemase|nr:alanine racemase [Helicobacteraceae bacterium]
MSLIKLSRLALFHNLSQIGSRCGVEKIGVVLKDNAYGHGLAEIAPLCAGYGVRFAVVRKLLEAEKIAPLFDEVLVLSDRVKKTASNISFAVNDIDLLPPEGANVHIKVDSGMHRNGVALSDLEGAIELLSANGVVIRAVFSHLRSADIISSEFFWQEKNFNHARNIALRTAERLSLESPKFHLYNSAGLFRAKDGAKYDYTRVGIAMYGYCDLTFPFESPELKPVLSLWADRVSKRHFEKGDRAGYAGVFRAEDDFNAGVYDVGYGDGFLRLNGGEGYEIPGGGKLLGRVSMDNVIVRSDQERICIMDDAKKFAGLRGTISYEVLARLNGDIPRVVI